MDEGEGTLANGCGAHETGEQQSVWGEGAVLATRAEGAGVRRRRVRGVGVAPATGTEGGADAEKIFSLYEPFGHATNIGVAKQLAKPLSVAWQHYLATPLTLASWQDCHADQAAWQHWRGQKVQF
uniref:Uncharacterized protein n=1 Tax=Oryza brachyantha TaxID=4533 RepID=J3MQP8_ORYBR